MLRFIGSGSAFNTALGNNGAFIKKHDVLFMIDCGSTTFERLQRYGVLNGVNEVHVLLTHLHPDHVGSLGDLIFYGFYAINPIIKPSVTVHAPYALKVKELLNSMGVKENTYQLAQFGKETSIHINGFHVDIKTVPVKHVKDLDCYGYILDYDGAKIYYSGDSNMIPISAIVELYDNRLTHFYQDTCGIDYDGNVHLSLSRLTQLIYEEKRHKVYCMHLDKSFNKSGAEELGFNVVTNHFDENK